MNKYESAIAKAQAGGEPVEGDNFIVHPSVDTTMRIIDEAISAGKPHGYAAIALTQTSGVGTKDPTTGEARKWWSGEGNLMASFLFYIQPSLEHPKEIDMLVAAVVGNCLEEFLEGTGKKATWKYPNDILVDGAKISGILTRTHPEHPDRINVGIGVNIAATPPPSAAREKALIKRATCLHECGAVHASVAGFLEKFDQKFETALAEYRKNRDFENVLEGMGFVQPGTRLLSVAAPSGEVMTGFYGGFRTARNEHNVEVDFLRINRDGAQFEFPYRDLQILTIAPPHPKRLEPSVTAKL